MNVRALAGPSLVFAAMAVSAHLAWAEGFELGESKEQLKLKYDVEVADHGTGRVTVTFTLVDEGRLKPLDRGVSLVVPSDDGTKSVDLSVSVKGKRIDGKQI